MRTFGPCPTCGLMFQSRAEKKFCCQKCYQASPECLARLRGMAKNANDASIRQRGLEPRAGEYIACLNCGKEHYRKPSDIGNRKYCNKTCYRQYLARRFDRFVANPERIALPQNYDEFLTGGLLNCLVDGCGWKGHQLSLHMNLCHGIPKDEFKKLGGFNLKTGVISAPLRETLEERDAQGIAIAAQVNIGNRGGVVRKGTKNEKYVSREAVEHWQKSRTLKLAEYRGEIVRKCRGCGADVVQSTPFGRTLFCSVECRDKTWIAKKAGMKVLMICGVCGNPFDGSYDQARRVRMGKIVVCSYECRQRRAGRIARGTWDYSQEQGLTDRKPVD